MVAWPKFANCVIEQVAREGSCRVAYSDVRSSLGRPDETMTLSSAAFFAPYTEHVGTEQAMIGIARGFEREGVSVDLLRAYREWPPSADPPGRVVSLNARWSDVAIDRLPFPWKKFCLAGTSGARLAWYLLRNEPDVLVTGLLSGVAAGICQALPVETETVISVQGLPQRDRIRAALWPCVYPGAAAVVASVDSVAARTAEVAEMPQENVEVIPNPVVTDELLDRCRADPGHPWFDGDDPVVVSVGRQTRQKDFGTLLRAFARVRDRRRAKLLVPGKEGDETERLRDLVAELGIGDDVEFPGFVDNPYAYMAGADVFVLSSKWEGPGHVIIEALAAETPVVATDCPLGPRDLLRDGDAGVLVSTEDDEAMAAAISDLIDDQERGERLMAAGQTTVDAFRAENAAAQYYELCRDL